VSKPNFRKSIFANLFSDDYELARLPLATYAFSMLPIVVLVECPMPLMGHTLLVFVYSCQTWSLSRSFLDLSSSCQRAFLAF
jgi:hypothetical protein